MATIKPALKEILERYGIDPRDSTQIWDCHGTLVLLHKAYEHIQAIENIQFDPPTIIEGCTDKKTVALVVVGHMKDKAEWSIGEASPANCKNAYPYAMAEKRAKDRVIGKLVGLAEHCHSEDEADDFKDARPAQGAQPPAQQRKPEDTPKPPAKPPVSTGGAPAPRYSIIDLAGEIVTEHESGKSWMAEFATVFEKLPPLERGDFWHLNNPTYRALYAAAQQLPPAQKEKVIASLNKLEDDVNKMLPKGIAA